MGVLLFSSAMIIPLLTWSNTVKQIGKRREEESIGRSIIIVWGLLIFWGFCTIFIGVVLGLSYQERFQVRSPSPTTADNFTCTPPDNVLDLTAGQKESWGALYITQEFIEANVCSNPCTKLQYDTLLKPIENLKPVQSKHIDYVLGLETVNKSTKYTVYVLIALGMGGLAVIWSMLQALTVLMFGRRTPTQVRNKTYLIFFSLFMDHHGDETVGVSPFSEHVVERMLIESG